MDGKQLEDGPEIKKDGSSPSIVVIKPPPDIAEPLESEESRAKLAPGQKPRNKHWELLRSLLAKHELVQRAQSKQAIKKSKSAVNRPDDYVPTPLEMPAKQGTGATWMKTIRNYWISFNKACCVSFKPEMEEDDADTDEPWMFQRRSSKQDDFVELTYNAYCKKRVRPTHIEARNKLLVTLRVCLQASTHLHVSNLLCKELVRTLSFSGLYVSPRGYSDAEQKLVKGKTILGSYMWLFTHGLKDLVLTENERNYVTGKLATMMADSVELTTAIAHVTKTAEYCLDELDFAIVRHMFTLHGIRRTAKDDLDIAEDVVREEDDEMLYEEYELSEKELRRLYHRHRAMKKLEVQAKKKFVEACEGKPKSDANVNAKEDDGEASKQQRVKVLGRVEGTGIWHHAENFPLVAKINVLTGLLQKSRTIIAQSLRFLEKVHRKLVSRPRKLNLYNYDGAEIVSAPAANIFEAAIQVKEALDKQHEFPAWLLTHTEADDLRQVGFLLLDRVDDLRDKLFALKQVGREIKYIDRLCYEFIEKCLGWPIKSYSHFAPEIERKWFAAWAHNGNFKAAEGEPELKVKNIRALFNSSVYPKILETVPLKLNELELITDQS